MQYGHIGVKLRDDRIRSMRSIFMGSPEFALPALEALTALSEVAGVVTQPDRPAWLERDPAGNDARPGSHGAIAGLAAGNHRCHSFWKDPPTGGAFASEVGVPESTRIVAPASSRRRSYPCRHPGGRCRNRNYIDENGSRIGYRPNPGAKKNFH
jgi:hypothetical protein